MIISGTCAPNLRRNANELVLKILATTVMRVVYYIHYAIEGAPGVFYFGLLSVLRALCS